MKAVLTDEDVKVYNSMEDTSLSIATLHKGDEVDLGKVTRKKNETWVEISLPNDQKGYIAGETKIFTVKRAQLTSKSADLHEAPDETSPILKTYIKGDLMTVKGVETQEAGNWFKIVEEPDLVGYLASSSVKLRVVPELTRSAAIRNLVTGGIFAVIGIVLSLLNSDPTQQNSMIYISYAVIFFGLLQMGQGAFELYKLSKQKAANTKA
ncbi:hypothetical protein SDC9_66412 [bioreactor metagenome]|uniref:SH3b domain-containing protein n=1 Tax=bioreactor metagenome TaxID=1076179 RepID=A0A644XUZ2_9ZZZZ